MVAESPPKMAFSTMDVRKLREKTGAGMMDCKRALQETNGDFEKAIDYLRKKGVADAAKRSERIATEGVIESYIHGGGRIGVLVEVNSETDFVARNDKFKEFVRNVALQVAASHPLYVSEEDVPASVIAREKEIYQHQASDKIVDGKLQKYFDEVCLTRQAYIKDPDKKVSDLLKELISQVGENCRIRRFARFELGEGLVRKSEDFAAEVAKQVKQ